MKKKTFRFDFLIFFLNSDDYSKCFRKSLEANGLLNDGAAFNYVVNNDLTKTKWALSDDNGETQCSGCLLGCKKADGDPATICKAVQDAKIQTQPGREQIISRAKPIEIIVIVIFYPGGVILIIIW